MRQDAKKIIKIASVSILFIFIVLYAFFRSKDLIFGVQIKNVNIVDGAKVTNNIMNITGTAKNATDLTLDGREISVDQQGNFNETIALLPGYNVIDIKAQDKFGHVDEKNYKVIY
jgi:hypothetical protein